jgi:hypothetical protein
MPETEADRLRRMEAFRALVEAQDGDKSVAQSRALVAERFGLSEHQVLRIEREGLDAQWPPLGEPPGRPT